LQVASLDLPTEMSHSIEADHSSSTTDGIQTTGAKSAAAAAGNEYPLLTCNSTKVD
jgi:hypothetical protein